MDATELSDTGGLGPLEAIAADLRRVPAEDDVADLAAAMDPGSVAGVIVYENLWAAPFAAAARRAGGRLIADGRIHSQDIADALEAEAALEEKEFEMSTRTSRKGRGRWRPCRQGCRGDQGGEPGPSPIAKAAVVGAAVTPRRRRIESLAGIVSVDATGDARRCDERPDRHARTMLPIPDRPAPGLTTYDAKDPDTAYPPIEPLRAAGGRAERAHHPARRRRLRCDRARSAVRARRRTPSSSRRGGCTYNRFHTTALCAPTRQALCSRAAITTRSGWAASPRRRPRLPATARCARTRRRRSR